jgi:hypothetical protein
MGEIRAGCPRPLLVDLPSANPLTKWRLSRNPDMGKNASIFINVVLERSI